MPPIRLGVVAFVNTLPLIDGLENLADIELCHAVPSRLIDMLDRGDVEMALCSSIDYQRSAVPLVVVPVGLLGCEGSTLTVRLYSQVPLSAVERVHCDTDSHTSVALMQILLREVHGCDPEIVAFDAHGERAGNGGGPWPQTMLLIGDKVVTDAPPAGLYPVQLDLGDLWHRHTGTPFVFATWMARRDGDRDRLATAAMVLDRQRRCNRQRIDHMIHKRAVGRGWPADLARLYLKQCLVYDSTPQRHAAMEIFFRKAHEHGLSERAVAIQTL